MFEPTFHLRQALCNHEITLQQLWVDNDAGKEEWRNIPVVNVQEEKEASKFKYLKNKTLKEIEDMIKNEDSLPKEVRKELELFFEENS
jgi:hypothetical protein